MIGHDRSGLMKGRQTIGVDVGKDEEFLTLRREPLDVL
jgi:hypothetical protein